MKLLALLLMMHLYTAPELSTVRNMYTKAPSDEKQCKQLVTLLDNIDETKQPLLGGYKACATMIMAKHAFNPFSKWSYFNKGKKMLEKAVAADTANIELRYLRFMAQSNAPSFLGYKKNIGDDRLFLQRTLPHIKDAYLNAAVAKALKG